MSRILFVLDELFPVRGAPQVRIKNLMAALPDWTVRGVGGQHAPGDAPSEFYLLDRPAERRPLAFVLFLRRLGAAAVRVARQERPDVIVVSVPKYEMLAIAPRLKKNTGRLILDFRDSLAFLDYGAYLAHFLPTFVAHPVGRIFSRLNRLLQRRAIAAADVVTVANEGIKATVDHPQVVVVPNGVDTESFRPEGKRWFDGTRPLRLVYLGNFAEKDRFEWLEAFEGRTDVELHLIGDGRNRERVVANLGGLNVVVHGVVPHEKLPALLAQMDLGFIFRDKGVDQSIPVCLFEFTAMNIPSICNDTGLMAHFVRERDIGFVVEGIDELKGLINRIVRDPRDFGRYRCLHAVAERSFSLSASREIFRQLIAGNAATIAQAENGA